MSEEIIKVLDNLAQKFGIAIDWTSQNIMPYLQELISRFIQYQNVIAITWIITSIIIVVISIIAIIKVYKWTKKNKYDSYDDEYILAMITYIIVPVLITIFIIVLFSNIFGLIQNIHMPELTILNYIKTLI
ncbi:MAG: hypothetical protein HFJ48_00015 [Clostridia bacterium]|nr:hypothetical protein [Clostridia bacterium]